MRRGFVTAVAVIFSSLLPTAQSPVLRFEVTSVKPHEPNASGRRGGLCAGTNTTVSVFSMGAGGVPATSQVTLPPGMCTFRQTPLRAVINTAYAMRRGPGHQPVVGGPDWIDTDLFDIDGRPDRPRPQQELEQMLQALLADRFSLRVHRETREVDGFTLTVAPRGSKLSPSQSFAGSIVSGVGTMTTQGAAVDRLAQALGFRLGKHVVNDTGLTGVYAFTLRWTPGDGELPLIPGAPPDVLERFRRDVDPHGPSLFTALDEQLGLRLQPRKVPLEFLVIDAVERPTPN